MAHALYSHHTPSVQGHDAALQQPCCSVLTTCQWQIQLANPHEGC